jgi:hypothetical protein
MGETMNDDFLTQFQKPPRAEFESALYKKINKPIYIQNKKLSLRRLGYSFGIVIALLALTVIFVPNARAAVQSVIRKIAGISFDEVTELQSACDPMKCEPEDVIGIMPFEKAQSTVPFAVNLPTWTPEGYWLNPRVSLIRGAKDTGTIVAVEWLRSGLAGASHEDYVQQMTLRAWQDQGENQTWSVAPESATEIKVNGKPAALVHGGWMLFSDNWNGEGMTSIAWLNHGTWYQLSAVFHDPSTAISDEDMIRIAESIP